MSILRRGARLIGSVTLWALAVVGAGSLTLWGLNLAGLVQPLVVVSGSMSPSIATGDLLFATATDARDLAVGDVATVRSARTGDLVTHRVTGIERVDGATELRMQGDANPVPDLETYRVPDGERVWQPRVTIAGGGYVVSALMRPVVSVPLTIGILALCALGLFPDRRAEEPAVSRRAARRPATAGPSA